MSAHVLLNLLNMLGKRPELTRFKRKTRITEKATEIPERPKNNKEILIGASAITFID